MDRKTIQLILLILLIACSQQSVQKEDAAESTPELVSQTQNLKEEIPMHDVSSSKPGVTSSLRSEIKTQTTRYKLSQDNRILAIGEWKFFYHNGNLVQIKGSDEISFAYDKQLQNITINSKTLTFKHDSRGRLTEVKGGRENLYLEYDSLDLLRSVRRGVAGKTSIDYDKKGRIKYLTRGLITTNVYYNNHSFVNNFDADYTKLILAYWKDDKLISLSGKTFGPGLDVGYGTYPPKKAKILHTEDKTEFEADSTEALYAVVDYYLYCNYISRHKDLLFDGTSYTFFTNYFKKSTTEYFIMQTVCNAFEN